MQRTSKSTGGKASRKQFADKAVLKQNQFINNSTSTTCIPRQHGGYRKYNFEKNTGKLNTRLNTTYPEKILLKPKPLRIMQRTSKSTGGKAPRKQLATKAVLKQNQFINNSTSTACRPIPRKHGGYRKYNFEKNTGKLNTRLTIAHPEKIFSKPLRIKQITNESTGGKAPREQLATKAVLKQNQFNHPTSTIVDQENTVDINSKKTPVHLTRLYTSTYSEKILFKPRQEIEFHGFGTNSDKIRILPTRRKEEIQFICQKLLNEDQPSIRSVAAVVSKLEEALPAVQYGALHFWEIKKDIKYALKQTHGYLDKKTTLSSGAKLELQWWCDNILLAYRPIDMGKPTLVIDSDASGSGWGATDTKTEIGGRWNNEEREKLKLNGINYLEMLAAYLALKSFCKQLKNIHVRLRIDNMTAVTYLTNMGGVNSRSCNEMAKKIWHWCIQNHIWISVEHIPGRENVVADFKSRNFNDETEWQLNKDIFNQICQKFGTPEIDSFASRLNNQLPRYIARDPDPEAWSVDAFMTYWGNILFCTVKIASLTTGSKARKYLAILLSTFSHKFYHLW